VKVHFLLGCPGCAGVSSTQREAVDFGDWASCRSCAMLYRCIRAFTVSRSPESSDPPNARALSSRLVWVAVPVTHIGEHLPSMSEREKLMLLEAVALPPSSVRGQA
jgi:hypothetical protein